MNTHQIDAAADRHRVMSEKRRAARVDAVTRALQAGLNANTADAVAQSAMVVWAADLTPREWREFIDEEIERQVHP